MEETVTKVALFLSLAAAAAPDAEIKTAAERMAPALVETRRDIHRHPELGNREVRTGKLVADRLKALGLDVRHPVAKTGVVGVLKGGKPGAVVAIRADLDALPIQETNDVPYKSEVAGEARLWPRCPHDDRPGRGRGALEDEGPALRNRCVRLPARGRGTPQGEEGEPRS